MVFFVISHKEPKRNHSDKSTYDVKLKLKYMNLLKFPIWLFCTFPTMDENFCPLFSLSLSSKDSSRVWKAQMMKVSWFKGLISFLRNFMMFKLLRVSSKAIWERLAHISDHKTLLAGRSRNAVLHLENGRPCLPVFIRKDRKNSRERV